MVRGEVNFAQITTIDKSELTEMVGMLPRNVIQKFDAALKRVLGIV
jgi:mRNA-degrading endonuclease toxin of MazEF toxin-antitoxin module